MRNGWKCPGKAEAEQAWMMQMAREHQMQLQMQPACEPAAEMEEMKRKAAAARWAKACMAMMAAEEKQAPAPARMMH